MAKATLTPLVPTSIRYEKPAGPRGSLILGSAGEMQKNPTEFLMNLRRHYGDVASMRFLSTQCYAVFHPDDVKHVIQGNHMNYNKDLFTYKTFEPFLGKGLLTNDGASWLHQRRLMQPAFHRKRIAGFATLMTNATTDLLHDWQSHLNTGQPLDVDNEMTNLTMRIVAQALFSIDIKGEASAVGEAITVMNKGISNFIYKPFPPLSIPTPRNRRLLNAKHALDEVVFNIIAERRRTGEQKDDLLSMLLEARDEASGEGMNDQQVRDEVITLLTAGHETTANTLTWAWYLLSQHPDVQQRLYEELDTVLHGQVPTMSDLSSLPYTRMVIEETLRLYTPIWIFSKNAIAEDTIGGFHVPARTMIILSPYVTHRHPDFWDEPERFDPERFTPERVAARHHYAYFPFAGGPRMCIGNNFAMMEAQLILATIAQRYRLQLIPDFKVEPHVQITVRPRYGLKMTLHEQ